MISQQKNTELFSNHFFVLEVIVSVLQDITALKYECFFITQASLGKKEKSKGLFYKALQNCPWAKVSTENR